MVKSSAHKVRVSHVIKVSNVQIAPGVVQAVKFRTGKRGVFCTSKGKPRLIVTQASDGKRFEAGVWDREARQALGLVFLARNPAKAFALAVKEFWAD